MTCFARHVQGHEVLLRFDSVYFDLKVLSQLISDKRELHGSGILDVIDATDMIRRQSS